MKNTLTILAFFFACALVNAQDIPRELLDQIENYIEEEDDDVDILNLVERLRILSQNPVDLNKLDAEELQELRILSDIQINDILDHRAEYGNFVYIEELQSIPSFQLEDIIRLRSFVVVNKNEQFQMSIPQMIKNSQNVAFIKWSRVIEEKKGYIKDENGEANYVGDPNRFLIRYRNNFENKLRFGFIMDKDPGEQYFGANDNLGIDYLSFHGYLRDYTKKLKDVAVGDYTISLGQGLISHNGFGAGKGALTTQLIRGGRTVRPYSSVNENGYYRGAATTVRLRDDIELTGFVSRVKRDGNIQLDTFDLSEPSMLFSSLQLSGNHRTASEIEDRKSIGITSFGSSLKYKVRKGHVAVNFMHHSFDNELQRSDDLYNKYRFEGNSLTNASIDYNYRLNNFNIFGESALAFNQGSAHLLGAMIGVNKYLSAAILYRNYAKDYNALESNAFGESSSGNNENGVYFGMEYQLSRKWKLRSYVDIWSHPWLRFTVSRPSSGLEYYWRLDYYLKRKLLLYFQFSHENKLNNYTVDDAVITQVGDQDRYRFRIHLANQLTKGIELRTRAEYSILKNPVSNSKGYLLYQDIIYKSLNSPLSLTARLAFFDTDDFNSRIFAFENSVLYEFGIPAYFDQGFRYYINLRYRGLRNTTIELRYAKTHITNDDSFSSGNEEIIGDVRSEVKVQLRYGF